ncbi:MAG TPA: NACHT domain-containing protein [Thermoleophilaceae bacterium]
MAVATRLGHTLSFRAVSDLWANERLYHEEFLPITPEEHAEAIAFEQAYKAILETETGTLSPPYVDSVRRVPIDSLYVTPTVQQAGRAGRGTEFESPVQLLGTAGRATLLGNPGAGKSTYALKLAHDLISGYEQGALLGRELTPVLVVLREYASRRTGQRLSLLDFAATRASEKYGIPAPAQVIQRLALSGRICLLLDGLDELLDVADRRGLIKDIHRLTKSLPGVPVLVTSREVGYLEAPLDHGLFTPFRLTSFSEAQVQSYAENWFGSDRGVARQDARHTATAFMRDSEAIPDLRANALLLALLCQIYKGEAYIPRNRPDVYEKCATMLFERWDRSRGLFAPSSIEAHLRPTMEFLAHWIYTTPELAGGVRHAELVKQAAAYLHEWRFSQEADARAAALEFVDFCRGRAWVFTEIGTADGEALYQFSHRTFLEYFAALHLVRTHGADGTLEALLIPRIRAGEWDNLAQMALQLRNKFAQGAGDTFLLRVLADAESDPEPTALISFAMRSLEGVVPRPSVTKAIVDATVSVMLAMPRSARGKGDSAAAHLDTRGSALVPALVNVSVENRVAVGAAVREAVDRALADETNISARLNAVDLALNYDFYVAHGTGNVTRGALAFWREESRTAATKHNRSTEELAKVDYLVAHDLVRLGRLTVEDFLEMHGGHALFRSRSLHGGSRISIGAAELYWLASEEVLLDELGGSGAPDAMVTDLASSGSALITTPTPWASDASLWADDLVAMSATVSYDWMTWPDSARFGAVGLLMYYCESHEQTAGARNVLLDALSELEGPWADIAPLFRARLTGGPAELSKARRRLGELQLNPSHIAFAARWAEHKVRIIRSRVGVR